MCPAVLLCTLLWLWAGFLGSFRKGRCTILPRALNRVSAINRMRQKKNAPGFASLLQAILAFEGMMNSSRKLRKGSASSREAAYSFVSASAGNTGLMALVGAFMMALKPGGGVLKHVKEKGRKRSNISRRESLARLLCRFILLRLRLRYFNLARMTSASVSSSAPGDKRTRVGLCPAASMRSGSDADVVRLTFDVPSKRRWGKYASPCFLL